VPQTNRKFYEEETLKLLPEKEPWVVMEALIELGALVCLKKPQCQNCPLQTRCKAHLHGTTEQLPVKKVKEPTIFLKRQVAVVRYEDEVLVCKRGRLEVMADLYEFPYAEMTSPLPINLPLKKLVDLPIVKHSFTRYQATLYPTLYEAIEKKNFKNFEWKKIADLKKLPFSSGHRKICENLTH
jgi:A/G-specific adenine glycosylase